MSDEEKFEAYFEQYLAINMTHLVEHLTGVVIIKTERNKCQRSKTENGCMTNSTKTHAKNAVGA